MSSVFVQPGFVNRSSIAAAVCLRVDREPQRTPGERRGDTCAHLRENTHSQSQFFFFFFPLHPSLSLFYSPRDGKGSSCHLTVVAHANCFSHQFGLFIIAKKRNNKTYPISSILTALLCCSSRQTISCCTLSTLPRLIDRTETVFFS